ncbi:MAG TPA: histidinol dehydrogenase [Longimicrobiales bacterium]|nr:histidinol dehydrogenase [Longimicrobiales bacterium]
MTERVAGTAGDAVRFAAVGRLDRLDPDVMAGLLDRAADEKTGVAADVAAIIDRVRRDGDVALLRMAADFDGATLDVLEVPASAIEAALESIDGPIRDALVRAAGAIAEFHRAQLPEPVTCEPLPGVRLTRIAEPLDRVGIYSPGGRAAYPSSVLMGAVPARVAGVREVIVCSPPAASGLPAGIVLAACAIARVDRVFSIGGAGAIAALAYGTESVPRTARVVGPGNAWVAEAKRQLQGTIAIDCPAGPSELLILADASASPAMLAAELVAQAEHDPDAAVILVATDDAVPAAVAREIDALVRGHPREVIIRAALETRGALLAASRAEALDFASAFAPEHLLIALTDARSALPAIRNAGTIFVGESSSVAFGDYMTGANHVLPTGGMARSFSGLDVLDFIRWTTVQEVSPAAAAALAAPTALLADAEGLPGHAFAARLRMVAPDPAGEPSWRERVSGSGSIAGSDVAGPSESRTRVAATRTPRPRQAYASISTYDPGRKPVAVDLSDNTNLFGICPAVADVLAGSPAATTTRYPSVYADALIEAAAARFGVATANVVSGCGSDDVIDSAVRAFCDPGDVVAYPWPTFGIVPTFARMNATTPVAVPGPPGAPLDVAGLLAAKPRLVYVCRPNNPTGDSARAADVVRLADAFDGVVLVDEAYADFADDDLLRIAVGSGNVIVLRTLSKACGMAGLRVGFAVGPDRLIAEVTKSRGPYKVSSIAERAGEAVLRDGQDWVDWCVQQTRINRSRLREALGLSGHDVLPSDANFVLIRLPPGAGGAQNVADRLRRHGIGVRPFAALPGLGDCIRVTIGPWDMMQAFLDALDAEVPVAQRARN